jgi:hypothetical protein
LPVAAHPPSRRVLKSLKGFGEKLKDVFPVHHWYGRQLGLASTGRPDGESLG